VIFLVIMKQNMLLNHFYNHIQRIKDILKISRYFYKYTIEEIGIVRDRSVSMYYLH